MNNKKSVSLLEQLPPDVLAMASRVSFGPEEHIIQAHDPTPHFYLIEQGSAKLVHESPDAVPLIIDIYHPGDFCGEMEMVGLQIENRSIVALSQCELLRYTKEQFYHLWDTCREFSRGVLDIHCRRLLKAGDDKVYVDCALLRQRVFRVIQSNINAKGYFVYTKQVLAELTGISIRSLNRTLGELQQDRLILVDSGTIRLYMD